MNETPKNSSWKGAVVVLFFILVFVLVWPESDNDEPVVPEPSVAPLLPKDYGQVLVKVNFPENPSNVLQCYFYDWTYTSNVTKHLNYSFVHWLDTETIVQEKDGVIYRMEMWQMRPNNPFDESPEFKELAKNFKKGVHDSFECRGYILEPSNGVHVQVWDEGYNDNRTVSLYDCIEVNCVPERHPELEGRDFECVYRVGNYDNMPGASASDKITDYTYRGIIEKALE